MPRSKSTARPRKFHLHAENSAVLNEVFETSPKRVRDAFARHPDLKDRLRVTAGYGGDILENSLRTADALFCHQTDFNGLETQGLFTAIWVPSILAFGIYFKLAALAGRSKEQ